MGEGGSALGLWVLEEFPAKRDDAVMIDVLGVFRRSQHVDMAKVFGGERPCIITCRCQRLMNMAVSMMDQV